MHWGSLVTNWPRMLGCWEHLPFLTSENWWKLTSALQIFWAKIPCAFRKFRWKKMHCTSRFFVFYVKHKINLTWPNMKRLHFSGFTRWSAMVKTWGVFSNNLTTHKKDTSFSSSKNSIRCTNVLLVLICCTLVPYI